MLPFIAEVQFGTYLGVAGHYNISSRVRQKLGLDSNGENLGPFIRKMMGEEMTSVG